MKDHSKKEVPACFGKLEIVFPKGDDGLRHSPESCMPCFFKKKCIQSAMNAVDGLKAKEEQADRAYESGLIGFFERWSMKKDLNRKIQIKIKESI
ncbi:MAG: hypothetical protein EHJ94_06850 [Deltaproteobacteria bacterium]|nr:MAG: hypothetical protein EHJ94_06850 [Deltaproteobacteria bacterium]